MTSANEAKCIKIAEVYGFNSQLEMLVEECSELIQAVQKYKRAEHSNAEAIEHAVMHFIEKMGDVTIMLAQMRHYLTPELQSALNNTITKKLDRQLGRIDAETEEYKRWREGINA